MSSSHHNRKTDIHPIIATRWSPRSFDANRPVETEKLTACLEAARWSPSCFGDEPWRWLIADKQQHPELWQKMFDALSEGNQIWAKRAPVLILACASKRFSANQTPNRWARYDTGQAMMAFALQAVEEGLITHPMAGFTAPEVREAFAIPEAYALMSITAVGYAGDLKLLPERYQAIEQAERKRKPLSELAFTAWQQPWNPSEESPNMNQPLFTPTTVGGMALKNHMVMAPMTRNRAPECNATPLMATYYAQRATAGLIISEGSQISAQGVGYPATPGIYNDAHVASWKQVTDAVHAQGSHIYCQLWHCGRISHTDFHAGELPVAPSAIQAAGQAFTYEGLKDFVTPRALTSDEIGAIVNDYKHAAQCAMQAGFDGVEIHAANGYLIDQFLRDGSNQRTDAYGGSLINRSRFLMEVVTAVSAAVGANHVGVRLSPINAFNDMHDSDPQTLFNHVALQLSGLDLSYLHVVEVSMAGESSTDVDMTVLRQHFDGCYIANGGFDAERGHAVITSQHADLVAYGVPFLANPDLPERFKQGAELNAPDFATFYGGDAHGYTDYPSLNAAV